VDEALAAQDWQRMAAIDPQATRVLWDMQQARQPVAPSQLTTDRVGNFDVLYEDGKRVGQSHVAPQRAATGGGGAVPPPQSPSYRDIIDPTNPKQMLTVDGKVYQGGASDRPACWAWP